MPINAVRQWVSGHTVILRLAPLMRCSSSCSPTHGGIANGSISIHQTMEIYPNEWGHHSYQVTLL